MRLNDHNFTPGQAEIVAAVEWEDAEVSVIDIRQDEFRLSIIHLFQGEPYIRVLENREETSHFFFVPKLSTTSSSASWLSRKRKSPALT